MLDNDADDYEVDLERCWNSAQTLDWIAQIAGKTWATPQDIGDLVLAIDAVIGLQDSLCGMGSDHPIEDVRKHVERRLKAR